MYICTVYKGYFIVVLHTAHCTKIVERKEYTNSFVNIDYVLHCMYVQLCSTFRRKVVELITKTYLAKFRKKLSSGKKVSSLRKIAELIQKQNCTVNKSVEYMQEENWHIQEIYLAQSRRSNKLAQESS